MKKFNFSVIVMLAAIVTGVTSCNSKNKSTEEKDIKTEQTPILEDEIEERSITVTLNSASDSNVMGEVTFTEVDGVVSMQGTFTGLTPNSTHAIHLHDEADCSSGDGMSTGGHWNPTDEKHGKWNDHDGYHAGDIGNLESDENGNATITFSTDQWCIDCDDDTKNIIGTGIIVHEDLDDFKTQPTGNAGGRIACGEIKDHK